MNKTINIISQPIAAAIDGHNISVNKDTGIADLSFFQVQLPASENQDVLQGIAVSHVRLTSLQLEKLLEDLEKAKNSLK